MKNDQSKITNIAAFEVERIVASCLARRLKQIISASFGLFFHWAYWASKKAFLKVPAETKRSPY